MILHDITRQPTPALPSSFHAWRAAALARHELPVILISGSRGKSSVVRLLDAMLTAAGLRTATRTNAGVEILGTRQHGELAPWAHALEQLALGTLDVAIEELDWASIHAVGRDLQRLPLAIVTNVCGNRDACLITDEARRAMATLPLVIGATGPSGAIVLNGDDYAVTPEEGVPGSAILFAQSNDSPALKTHLARGGRGVWTRDGEIVAGPDDDWQSIVRIDEIPHSFRGAASFQVQNAMAAIAAGIAAGLSPTEIASGLQHVAPGPSALRDGFQTVALDGITVVLDRPNPSWFLRQVLRSIRDTEGGHLIAVTGAMHEIPLGDLPECGRLLGRVASMIVFHSNNPDDERTEAFRRGVALTEVPPPIVHTRTEPRAVERALAQAQPGDTVMVLTEQLAAVLRSIESRRYDIGTSVEPIAPLAL